MDDDPFKDRIDKAFQETDKWARIAGDFDKQLESLDQTSPDYEQVKSDHALAHSMASMNQADLEKLYSQRERHEQSRELDALHREPEFEQDLEKIYFKEDLNDMSLRSIAEEYEANVGERDKLDQAIDDIEYADEEISPDHMLRAEETLRRMEDKHLAVDAARDEDQAIRHLGESHMALYEAGRESQDMTAPVPKPEVDLMPEMKIRR